VIDRERRDKGRKNTKSRKIERERREHGKGREREKNKDRAREINEYCTRERNNGLWGGGGRGRETKRERERGRERERKRERSSDDLFIICECCRSRVSKALSSVFPPVHLLLKKSTVLWTVIQLGCIYTGEFCCTKLR
jgi:hypothetical protein